MSFLNKVKGFFSRVGRGIKKGWNWVKDKVSRVVAPLYNTAKPVIETFVPGGRMITKVADTVLPTIQALSNDPKEALKQGATMIADKLRK